MTPAIQAQLFTVALGVCVVLALFLGVAVIVGVIDGRRQARDRERRRAADFERTVKQDPRQSHRRGNWRPPTGGRAA